MHRSLNTPKVVKQSIADYLKINHVKIYFYYIYINMFGNNYKYINTYSIIKKLFYGSQSSKTKYTFSGFLPKKVWSPLIYAIIIKIDRDLFLHYYYC